MRKIIVIIITSLASLIITSGISAQMMGASLPDRQGFTNISEDWDEVVEHTVREEQEGKQLWEKFQAKEVACNDLSDEQFGVLGEYFMGQTIGDSHEAMNAMIIQTHGENGEEQIHIVMGRRLSGCDTSATTSSIGGGWMPMMNIMTGGWRSLFGLNSTNSMMNFGYGFGFFGWIFMILWGVLIIACIIALIKWLTGQTSDKRRRPNKSALDILKERYAKGDIEKKEFEERKKDLI